MNNQLNKRERRILAKFLSKLAKDENAPPVIRESVSNLTFWFGQYLDMDSRDIIEKCLEGYAKTEHRPPIIQKVNSIN
jgi:hypothetical protein